MPLTLEALSILDAIDRKGSFARAAEELGARAIFPDLRRAADRGRTRRAAV